MLSRKRSFLMKRVLPGIGILRTSRGLTILELIIAFVVLQVAIMGFAQFITRALDYSREVRRQEMAQMLAQAKMEELLRTIPSGIPPAVPVYEAGTPTILNDVPGRFDDPVPSHSEDVAGFRWLAGINASSHNPNLLNVTLHVYVIKRRAKLEKVSEPVRDFYIPENREWFTFTQTLDDGSVEVIRGREKTRISGAVAIP